MPSPRGRFADLVERQLDLFEREQAWIVTDTEAALRAYNAADRDEAEERYGEYVDLVDTGTEALEELRDTFARTLDEETADDYRAAFNERVRRRLPRFGLELE